MKFKKVKFIEIESKMVITRGRGRGGGVTGEMLVKGHKSSVRQEGKVQELYCTAFDCR
jgi:hypothetical protein